MALMLEITIYFLVASSVISLVRVVIGPTVADRMIGLNLVASQILTLLVLVSVALERSIYLDVALVYDIFGFIGILLMTRYFSGKKGEI
ncbi:monovalent cation/H+ antiporter complex subunit F [Marispirochaeta aestuarii]|uniref:pH regulation protein F n=1 Tax=Marispirochaeta aestuarii TaxID=1963862 RepID=A0A1Y1RTU7_9SPIO|nr:monovalent cation/H+ antiporter complex subunit F [Marispirochaeta aestuarii]ORC31157.1 pH regulation protein F [Marispirochaeta aestuarii]